MKRTIVFLVTLALLTLGSILPVAQAAPSPEGALRSSFQAGLSGGNGNAYASLAHGSASIYRVANNAIFDPGGFTVDAGARRIIPGLYDQEYCASNVFGIWWYLVGPQDKTLLSNAVVRISINGTELALTRTAVKAIVDPQGYFGYPDLALTNWMSVGVPVLGTMQPGDYHVESSIVFGDGSTISGDVMIKIVPGTC